MIYLCSMKNNIIKLTPIEFDDIVIIGITSNLADFQLAWFINNKLSFNFVREKDIMKNGAQYAFYFYDPDKEGNYTTFNLVSLKYKGNYWRTASPRIDYLLIIRDRLSSDKLNEMIDKLNEIPDIGYVLTIDPSTDISLASILETIELHEVDILDEKNKENDIKTIKERVNKIEELRKEMLNQPY